MKLTKTNNNSLCFSCLWKTCSLLLLLVGISVKSFGQIYIGDNATVSIQQGTKIHISEDKTDKRQTAKVYVSENAQTINFPKDALVEIVYLKKEKQSQKTKKEVTPQNRSKRSSQPVLVKKETEPENRKAVLSFNSIPKTPSALLLAGKSTKAALLQNISSATKFFPQKNSHSNNIHSFLQKDGQQIKISVNELLLLQQANLEGYITRPPPIQIA